MDKLTARLVLKKYAKGERDFRHLNLRGQFIVIGRKGKLLIWVLLR